MNHPSRNILTSLGLADLDCADLVLEEVLGGESFRNTTNRIGRILRRCLRAFLRRLIGRCIRLLSFDLGLLDAIVRQRVVERYDHKHLNLDVEDYLEMVPTGENIVRQVWSLLCDAIPDQKLHRIRLVETRDNSFEYAGEKGDGLAVP